MVRLIPLLLGAATGALVVREHRERRAAERFAGAALETLLNAVDANDPQTGAHVRRVATYALILAEAAELDEHQRRSVERVALFHDIGKIHEALFDIIHEDDGLTEQERRQIRTHPRRGAEVLAPLASFYPDLPEGVLSHHERWDGSGYPHGLAAEQIPLSARIVCIADTFDAITHERKYRDGRGPAHAAAVITDGAGTQFDPALASLLTSPPVWRRIVRALRETRAPRTRSAERRQGHRESGAPDVTFRWRNEARALHAPDRAPTEPT